MPRKRYVGVAKPKPKKRRKPMPSLRSHGGKLRCRARRFLALMTVRQRPIFCEAARLSGGHHERERSRLGLSLSHTARGRSPMAQLFLVGVALVVSMAGMLAVTPWRLRDVSYKAAAAGIVLQRQRVPVNRA